MTLETRLQPFALTWIDALHGLRPGTAAFAFSAVMSDLTAGEDYVLDDEGHALLTPAAHLLLVARSGWQDPASVALRGAMALWGCAEAFASRRAYADANMEMPGPKLTEEESAERDREIRERFGQLEEDTP